MRVVTHSAPLRSLAAFGGDAASGGGGRKGESDYSLRSAPFARRLRRRRRLRSGGGEGKRERERVITHYASLRSLAAFGGDAASGGGSK